MDKTMSQAQETLQEAILNMLSIRRPSFANQLATELDRSYTTVLHNLEDLEKKGKAFCPNHKEKPKRWYAEPDYKTVKMSKELAVALITTQEMAQSVLPTEIFQEVELVFEQAKKVCEANQRNNRLSKVVKYQSKVDKFNLQKYLLQGHVSLEVLQAINDSLYSESELTLYTSEGVFTLSDITLVEMNNQLFLKGRAPGFGTQAMRVDASDIKKAESLKDIPIWQSPSMAA